MALEERSWHAVLERTTALTKRRGDITVHLWAENPSWQQAAFESPNGCSHLAGSWLPQHVQRSQPWLQPWPPVWGKRFSNQIFQNQFSSRSKVLAVTDNNFLHGFLNYQIKMLNGFKLFWGQDSPSSGILRGTCKEIWLNFRPFPSTSMNN